MKIISIIFIITLIFSVGKAFHKTNSNQLKLKDYLFKDISSNEPFTVAKKGDRCKWKRIKISIKKIHYSNKF